MEISQNRIYRYIVYEYKATWIFELQKVFNNIWVALSCDIDPAHVAMVAGRYGLAGQLIPILPCSVDERSNDA